MRRFSSPFLFLRVGGFLGALMVVAVPQSQAWQIMDPMNDVGYLTEYYLAYVTMPGSDILRAGFFENETEIRFEVEFQDLRSLESSVDTVLSWWLSFDVKEVDRPDPGHFVYWGQYIVLANYFPKLVGVDSQTLPPALIWKDRELHLDAWRINPDNTTTDFNVTGSVDLDRSAFVAHIPKQELSRLNPQIGPEAQVISSRMQSTTGPCYPGGTRIWFCSSGGVFVYVGADYAPQSGDSPWGYGDPLKLFWQNATEKTPPNATEALPGPSGSAPAASTLLVALSIAGIGLIFRRRMRA